MVMSLTDSERGQEKMLKMGIRVNKRTNSGLRTAEFEVFIINLKSYLQNNGSQSVIPQIVASASLRNLS